MRPLHPPPGEWVPADMYAKALLDWSQEYLDLKVRGSNLDDEWVLEVRWIGSPDPLFAIPFVPMSDVNGPIGVYSALRSTTTLNRIMTALED